MSQQSRILDAIAALEARDRRTAVALIEEELREGEPTGQRWKAVYRLANKIGEIDMAMDASQRFALTPPTTLTQLISHCGSLTHIGRSEEAVALLERLPARALEHPAALHFLGMIDSENGDFDAALAKFRKALAGSPNSSDSWFALAMVKTFEKDDPDFKRMASIEPLVEGYDALTRARYFYAMGKALVDMGEVDKGFDYYARGASLRRMADPYDRAQQEAMAERLISDFTPDNLARLTPSQFTGQRALFVNGLPRSGTTLVESILVSHSRVTDGAEVNLVKSALIPTGDYSLEGALDYQERYEGDDPWGQVARDYHHMLDMRFRDEGLVVDKTLGQSFLMGLLLHSMPDARIVWMRRRPEDIALSAYRTLFTSTVRWSWSWDDIAHQMKLEDKLYAHWVETFPERILSVQYEELVQDPDTWIPRIIDHVGLEHEPQLREFHKSQRKVRTASVQQVRAPINTGAVRKADRFADQLKPFRDAYYD